jgi:DNA polymerase I
MTIPYRDVWLVDFEYGSGVGERPRPLCMVAREVRTGTTLRLWRDGLQKLRSAPFPTNGTTIMCAYYAVAEVSCFLELGWSPPTQVLDLYVEHRNATNGLPTPFGDSLLGALRHHGITGMAGARKEAMRRLVLQRSTWSLGEQKDILDYCEDDVLALHQLLAAMAPGIDWPRALLRGRYMTAVAAMERNGVPIDTDLHRRLSANWKMLKSLLISNVDRDYGVYEGATFKSARFADWVAKAGIPWPRLDSGALKLDGDTFRDQSRAYPAVLPLKELRSTLSRLRLTGLAISPDGRNRCMLSPFRSITGRNQPSNTEFIFGPAVWMRGLIKPPPGHGLAYLDYAAQELALAGALSGDERLMEAYLSGDPYMSFAIAAGLAPLEANAKTHPEIRARCKVVCLGVNYGMSARSLAYQLNISQVDAQELIRLHKLTYHRFWKWSNTVVASAMLGKPMHTVFGWLRRLGMDTVDRSLMNHPMQANGAEMLRIACMATTEAGIRVACPVHDALLIEAPLSELEEAASSARSLMARASTVVSGGLPIRTDVSFVRHPDRYSDPRGVEMWTRVLSLLDTVEASLTH